MLLITTVSLRCCSFLGLQIVLFDSEGSSSTLFLLSLVVSLGSIPLRLGANRLIFLDSLGLRVEL